MTLLSPTQLLLRDCNLMIASSLSSPPLPPPPPPPPPPSRSAGAWRQREPPRSPASAALRAVHPKAGLLWTGLLHPAHRERRGACHREQQVKGWNTHVRKLETSHKENLGWFSVFMLIGVLFLPTPRIGFTNFIIKCQRFDCWAAVFIRADISAVQTKHKDLNT